MLKFKADLHLHSVLSPCGDLLMTPAAIVKKAKEIGLKILSLTDHNSAENSAVFEHYCEKFGLYFIPGMEVETKEEIHLLSFFPDLITLEKWQNIVYKNLPEQKNDEDFFGPQLKCDLNDEYTSKENRLLAAAVNLNLEETVNKVESLGGIVIPSHLDRKHSIISQLGFIPFNLDFKTVEISKNIKAKTARKKIKQLNNIQLMQNSDAHYLKEIKAYQYLLMKEFSFSEFKKAVQNKKGRKIELIT